MGIWDMFKGKTKSSGEEAVEKPAAPADLITVYDERGRELKITREVWGRDVLLPNIQKAWSDPDALYGHVVQALRDGLTDLVAEAAEHLVAVDQQSERALLVHAIVLMKKRDLDGAERQIERCLHQHGRTGTTLTNLAKVYEDRGQHERAMATLREALQADPNQDNAVLWWAALAREQGGEPAYGKALAEVASFQGAWRPQLWLARQHLQNTDTASAVRLYDDILERAADEPGVLMMVSGDLGNAGALEDLVRLTAPRYDPSRHGFEAGLNLAEALKALGRTEEARRVVRRLQELKLSPIAERLARLEDEIAARSLPQDKPDPPEVAIMQLHGPLWTRGLGDPTWLLPAIDETASEITFVVFANETISGGSSQVQKVDDAGRLTRALPLFLTEAMSLTHNVRATCMVPIARGHGPVVFGKPIELETAVSLIPARAGAQFVVLGSLVESGVHVAVWDLKTRARLLEVAVHGGPQDLGPLAGRLFDEVASGLSRRGLVSERPLSTQFRLPPDELRTGYLLSLEQLLYQVLAANAVVSPETFWNERGFFETHFGLVEAWPDAPLNARMLGICGVLAATRYKSTLLEPYRKIVLRWVEEASPGSPIAKLAPAIFKHLGDEQKVADWLKDAPRLQDAAYAEWLGRIQGEG